MGGEAWAVTALIKYESHKSGDKTKVPGDKITKRLAFLFENYSSSSLLGVWCSFQYLINALEEFTDRSLKEWLFSVGRLLPLIERSKCNFALGKKHNNMLAEKLQFEI